MIDSSYGRLKRAVVRRSLSGLSTAEIALPLDNFSDSSSFTLTTDQEREYTVIGSELVPSETTQVLFRAVGLLKSQEKYLQLRPQSFNEATAASILNEIGFSGGTQEKLSFVNLALTQAQLATLVANSSSKSALLDFEAGEVLYYEDLYKKKARQVEVRFQRIVQRVPQLGVYFYNSGNEAVIPKDPTLVSALGDQLNVAAPVMKRVVHNYNNLARLFSQMQAFVTAEDIELGATVLSPLTFTKGVVCAMEQVWIDDTHTTTYYAV